MSKEEFWNWFDKYKHNLEKCTERVDAETTEIWDNLCDKLKQYSEYLIPEIVKEKNNQFTLVISCDGVIKAIPFVESLVDDNRHFGNWKVQKYSSPDPEEVIKINGLSLKRSKIFLTWSKTSEKGYDIVFFIRGYSNNDLRYQACTILHIQLTVGEFNAMTRINSVQFERLPMFKSTNNLQTLDELKIEMNKNLH